MQRNKKIDKDNQKKKQNNKNSDSEGWLKVSLWLLKLASQKIAIWNPEFCQILPQKLANFAIKNRQICHILP